MNRKRETFLVLDSLEWLKGAKILSPVGSKHIDPVNPELMPSHYSPEVISSDPEDSKDRVPKPKFVTPLKLMDLSEFDNILIPINAGNSHWLLGRIRKTNGMGDHETVIYDSLGTGSQEWLDKLVKFRTDIYMNKYDAKDSLKLPDGTNLIITEQKIATLQAMQDRGMWTNNGNYVKSQNYGLQGDGSACGVFVMMYIAYLLTLHEDKIKADVTHENCVKVFRPWLTRMLCEDAVHAV